MDHWRVGAKATGGQEDGFSPDGHLSPVGLVGHDPHYPAVFHQQVFGAGFGQDRGTVFRNPVAQDVNEGVPHWLNRLVATPPQGPNWHCHVGLIEFNPEVG